MKEYVDMEVLRNSVERKYGYEDETDTDLDIEKFDEIYEAVRKEKLYFKIEDIINIFKLFIIDKSVTNDMQAWQQHKIQILAIYALRQNSLEKGLVKYAQGLKVLYDYMQQDEYKEYPLFLEDEIEKCLGYLLDEQYEMQQLEPFFKEINTYSEAFKAILREIVTEAIEDEYEEEFLEHIK